MGLEYTDFLNDLRFLPIYNDSGEEIPARALVKPTGTITAGPFGPVISVEKPDADNLTNCGVNGPTPIPIGGYGNATWDMPTPAAYDDGDGTPALGDDWGTENGGWYLRLGKIGYAPMGTDADGLALFMGVDSDTEEISLVSNVCPNTQHLCLAKRSSTLAIPTGATPTVITLNSEDFDTALMHSTSTNTSRITIQRSGYYRCTGHCEFTDISGGNGVNLSLLLNGAAAGCNDRREAFGGALSLDVYRVLSLEAGDYVEMQVAHDYGSDRNITTSTFLLVEEMAAPITVERRDVTVLAASEKACEDDPQDCCPAGVGSGYGSGTASGTADTIIEVIEEPLIDGDVIWTGGKTEIVTTNPQTIADIPLPPGIVTDDLLILFIYGSLPGFVGSGGPSPPVVDDGGVAWTPISSDYDLWWDDYNDMLVSIWWKLYDGDPAPSVDLTGWPNPSRVIMKIVGLRNVNLSDPIGPVPVPRRNTPQQNIGLFPDDPITPVYNQAVLVGWLKKDGWLNAVVPTHPNLRFRELLDYPISTTPELSAGLAAAINDYGTVTVPTQTITVNGGGAAGGLGFMLAINGGGTSGGAGGGTETCTSCTGGVAAAEYTLTPSGTTNGTCSDCSNVNAAVTFSFIGSCIWRSGNITVCTDAGAFWELRVSATDVRAYLFLTGGATIVGSYVYTGTWNCLSSLVLTKDTDTGRCGMPTNITINPV